MSLLDSVKVGKVARPRRVLLYGTHGVGKSTWAAAAPSPVFIQTEDGLEDIGCPRFPYARSLDVVLGQLRAVYEEKHAYKTVVIDSLDWLEKLIWAEVVKAKNVESIEDIGYAKGYIFALEHWRKIITALDFIREQRKMMVICVAHAQITRFESPETESYDRYSPAIHKHAARLVQEWADEILFAAYRIHVKTSDEGFNKKKSKGIGSGERIIRTEERPAWVAKNRISLPVELPLDWNAYAKHIANNGSEPKPKSNKKKKEVASHG